MKKLRKLFCLGIAVALVLGLSSTSVFATGGLASRQLTDIRSLSSWPTAPGVSSRSAIAIELNSGEVLFAQNENEQRYPASITKVMTALLVCENCSLDEKVTLSHNAVTDLEEGGFNGNFYEGEVLTVEQALYALLLNSVNECAYALAEHVAGSVEAFADMMNARAEELGCTNTHFVNPHGLNDPDHLTTAHDMALIFWACIQNETFYQIDSATSYVIPASDTTKKFTCQMHHKMMVQGSGYYNEAVKAGKTGYTSLAFHTLVTYAEKDGKEVIVVCMKESTGGAVIYQDTLALLQYAFNNFTLTDLSSQANSIAYGINASSPFPVKTDCDFKAFLPSSMGSVTLSLASSDGTDAASLGSMQVKSGDTVIMSKPLTIDASLIGGEKSALGVEDAEANVTAEDSDKKETKADTTEKDTENTAETTSDEKNESKSGSFLKILLIIFGIIIVLVIIWIFVVKLIRTRRARKLKARQDRQARLERIRQLRKERLESEGVSRRRDLDDIDNL